MDEKDGGFARAVPAWGKNNTSGKHEIHVRLDNLDQTLKKFDGLMKVTPKNTAIIAETLQISPDDVTPQLMFVYSTIHEMGHTLQYMEYEKGPNPLEAFRRDHAVERVALPIGNLLVSHLLNENHPNTIAVKQNWDEASSTASRNYSNYTRRDETISTMKELVDATSDVHRHNPSEADADRFAAVVLQMNPVMLTRLTGNIDRIRNYPQLVPAA